MEELLKYFYQQLECIERINGTLSTHSQEYHDGFVEGGICTIHSVIDKVENIIKEANNGNK